MSPCSQALVFTKSRNSLLSLRDEAPKRVLLIRAVHDSCTRPTAETAGGRFDTKDGGLANRPTGRRSSRSTECHCTRHGSPSRAPSTILAARRLGQEGPNEAPLLVGEIPGMRRIRKGHSSKIAPRHPAIGADEPSVATTGLHRIQRSRFAQFGTRLSWPESARGTYLTVNGMAVGSSVRSCW